AAERIGFKLVSVLDMRQQVLFDLREFRWEISSFFLRHSSRPFTAGLALPFAQSKHWGLGSATHAITLPKMKPRAMCEHFVMPSIGSRDVARAQWPGIRSFEHFL